MPANSPLRCAFPLLFALALTCGLLARPVPVRATEAAYQAAFAGTGLIFDDETGGSCWVVDPERRLGITNYHVVREKKAMKVYFPALVDGQVRQDFDYYRRHQYFVTATILRTDREHDLALIQFDHLPQGVAGIGPARNEPEIGEPLFNLGYDSHAKVLFVWNQTKLNRLSVAGLEVATVGALASPVYETKPNFRDGFSGGPVLNGRGELVGVVTCSKAHLGLGYIIKARDVVDLLRRAGVYGADRTDESEPADQGQQLPQSEAQHGTPKRGAAKPKVTRIEKKAPDLAPYSPQAEDDAPPVKRVATKRTTEKSAPVKRVGARPAPQRQKNESGIRGARPTIAGDEHARAGGTVKSGVR